MLRIAVIASLLLVHALTTAAVAEDKTPGPDTPVARVNGQVITLRTLENHLLREEGAEAIIKLVERQLREAAWERLADDTTIVAMGNWRLPRNVLAAQLLSQNGGPVRDQLIQIALIEQALRDDGVIIGDLLLQAERERMEQRFSARLQEMNQPQMPFAQFIQQSHNMSMQEFMSQPGFRMLAGLHALVLRRAQISDETLRAFYTQHRDHFGNPEQLRLRAILLDFEVSDGPDGRSVVLPQHRERLRQTASQLVRQINAGNTTFARQWELWGRLRDPQAGPGGDVGWVGRDGRRSQVGAPPLPGRLMEEAFRALQAGNIPTLLPPIEHSEGIVLAEVIDSRDANHLPFERVRDRVRRLYLESNMEAYSQEILSDLRRAAEIDYESLGAIVHHRQEELRRLTESGLQGGAESPEGASE